VFYEPPFSDETRKTEFFCTRKRKSRGFFLEKIFQKIFESSII